MSSDGRAGAVTEFRSHGSIREIGEAAWSGLLGDAAPPFLSYAWLDALESTGCVDPEHGWLPMHLTAHEAGKLVGAAPAYVKGNSEGEFVFDHAWARYANAALGIEYYPKLIVAVPFTPATAARILVPDAANRTRLVPKFAAAFRGIAEKIGASSAHVLFPTESEAEELGAEGFVRRYGVQFHWHNLGYATFDDFLARFNAKRRHQIRREMRELESQGTEIEIHSGESLRPELVDFVFDFYRSTVEKFFYGRQYLNRAFFEEVCSRMPEKLHVVVARAGRGGKRIGGAFNLLGKNALYGRYWGAFEDRPFLHFNVCFYRGVAECITRGLALFEPGAGGEHKRARGFEPTITHSAHAFSDARLGAAVSDFLVRERRAIEEHVTSEQAESGLSAKSAR